MESGAVVVSGFAKDGDRYSGTAEVDFSEPFAASPSIVLTCGSGLTGDVDATVSARSASGFTVSASRPTSGNMTVYWVASGIG